MKVRRAVNVGCSFTDVGNENFSSSFVGVNIDGGLFGKGGTINVDFVFTSDGVFNRADDITDINSVDCGSGGRDSGKGLEGGRRR